MSDMGEPITVAEADDDRRVALFDIYIRVFASMVMVRDWTISNGGEVANDALRVAKEALLVWERDGA